MQSEIHRLTDFRPFTSLTGQIADHLTDQIVLGQLAPDQRIQEQQVARTLGVSRGSVREALLLLERRHLIEIVPRRGAVVSSLSRRQIDDLFDLQQALYIMVGQQMARMWDEDDAANFEAVLDAITLAATSRNVTAYCDASEAFLGAALGLVRNHYLDSVVETLLPLSRRTLHHLVERDASLLDAGTAGWRALFEAMASRDGSAVQQAVSECFARHRAVLLQCVQH